MMLDFLYKFATPWAKANKIQLFQNRVLGKLANALYPIHCKLFKRHKEQGNADVIVSLTSFPGRIEKVHLCIMSLLNQDIRPKKIILWLADSQFPDRRLPDNLTRLKNELFDIRFCEDFRSYKKILPSAAEYVDKIIVTADDDVLYPEYWLRELLKTSEEFPNSVVCYRAHRIAFEDSEHISPYKKWIGLSPDFKGPDMSLVAIGVGGILYPADIFKDVNLDYEIIRGICPTTDDLWLKIIETKKGIPVVKVVENSVEWFTISNSQKEKLTSTNVEEGNNDRSFENLLNHYNIDVHDLENSR